MVVFSFFCLKMVSIGLFLYRILVPKKPPNLEVSSKSNYTFFTNSVLRTSHFTSGIFADISSRSSVRRIFFTFVPFLSVTFVHFTASSFVSWTVSPDASIFPNASRTSRFSDIKNDYEIDKKEYNRFAKNTNNSTIHALSERICNVRFLSVMFMDVMMSSWSSVRKSDSKMKIICISREILSTSDRSHGKLSSLSEIVRIRGV